MDGDLHLDASAAYAAPVSARDAGLAQASERWGRLAYGAALAFIANLYAGPAYYWPEIFDRLRLGVVTSAVCAFAVLMRRITSGERLKLGGPPAAFLAAYVLLTPLSFAWTISPGRTEDALWDFLKLFVVYVALLNALDTPGRLRTFLVVGALATLGPSLGSIQRWMQNDNLIEGYRTAWRGNYADPNRLAMALVLLLPACLALWRVVRRRWVKVALLVAAASNVAAIVLTHSRSGAVALAVALALALLRGRQKARGLVVGALLLAGMVALAPESFWKRNQSIADYEEDASFAGRERAYQMLEVIVLERPFTGVGSGAFLDAWTRFAPLSAGGQHLIAHNIFMEMLGELGIPGLALFAVFFLWVAGRLWAVGRDVVVGLEARALFAGLVGYIVCELVNGYSRAFNLFAALAVAVALIAQARLHARLAEKARAGGEPGGGVAA